MDAKFVSAIDRIASKLSLRLVDEKISPPIWGSDGSRCLLIEDLRLCASVVPLKHEIEIWLEDQSDPDGRVFSTGMLRAVLGQPYAGIMFSQNTYPACLKMMSELIEEIASRLLSDRETLIESLRQEYTSRLL